MRLDPLDAAALRACITGGGFDAVVNLAAATNVDRCEDDPQGAFIANVRVVELLAEALAAVDGPRAPHLVQVSSDQVYDGAGPHSEPQASPCNVYALSKYAGELAAAKIGATVLRTNLFGRSHAVGRTSLSDWVVSSLRSHAPITVFDDVLFSPLHTDTLTDVIERAIRERHAGTFNAGASNGLSKADFAIALAARLGLPTGSMTVGKSSGAKLRARRPLDMRMNTSLLERTFGINAPTLESQIDIAAKEYSSEQA